MLLNGVHLLPDASGALVWPERRLLAAADPVLTEDGRDAPRQAAEAVRRLSRLVRTRQPRALIWLGRPLPAWGPELPPRELRMLEQMKSQCPLLWVEDELREGPLCFRAAPPTAGEPAVGRPGEVLARPLPLAWLDGRGRPAFVIDGRRLALPAFGPRAVGSDAAGMVFQHVFRRPFQALILADGKIVTRPRARLEPPP